MITLREAMGWKSGQTFSDDSGEWNVDDILEWARSPGVVDIPITMLEHNLDPSPHETGDEVPGSAAFVERAEKSDLRYPIVVVSYPDGLWVADGVHRLWKARRMGKRSIRGHIIAHEALMFIPQAHGGSGGV